MSMSEAAARRVILAQAIETADTKGKLLSEVERDQIDQQARQEAGADGDGQSPVTPQRFLDLRARRVLQAIEQRNPSLAALQEPAPWQRWLLAGLPFGAMVLGVLTDVVANPHRVDLVSLPLLGLVLWNLFMYLLLLLGLFFMHGRPETADEDVPGQRRRAGLLQWRRGSGNIRADATALFHLRWQQAARGVTVQRWKRVLHLSAAAWAVGVALSLFTRGLVVEYRVGWESTFLDATQVHAILSFLRLPALLLFPFQPFSVQEVASLQFSQGGGAIAGARWVFMYVALLAVVVVVPRLVLAAVALWQERALSRKVPIPTRDRYYQRVLSLLSATRVQLCLFTHRPEDRTAVSRVLVQEPLAGRTLITSEQGDAMRLLDISGARVPVEAPRSPGTQFGQRLMRFFSRRSPEANAPDTDPLAAARQEGNIVLHVVGAPGDFEAALPLLDWLGRPVLLLVNRPATPQTQGPGLVAQCEEQARANPKVTSVLSFDVFARCWVQERTLLDAIRRSLPETARDGFDRIATAWEQRNLARFSRSMAAVADHLLFAARQVQEIHTSAITVRNLLPAERKAQAMARQGAMDEVVKRLDTSAAELFSRLSALHGIDEAAGGVLQHRMHEKFVVQQAVDTPQAGMAGAATGAAMGASVDLLVGGLTLGAAAALGAIVGGSAAYIAAAWKNRSTAAGSTIVQLSDEMLNALAEAALLHYLAVAHYGRGPAGSPDQLVPFWRSEVIAAVQKHGERLAPFWVSARMQPDPGRLASALGRELESIAREVLVTLYPTQPPPK